MRISIGHLYPRSMNTYGDDGNIICLAQRCAWRGINVDIHRIDIGDPIPPKIDLYFFGGGQDAAQASLVADLLTKGERLRTDMAADTPILAICGGYQLLGRAYVPFEGEPLQGINIFPVETHASHARMIGNVVISSNPNLMLSPAHPHIVGFENHSGKTTFLSGTPRAPLGTIRHGHGNNGNDKTEGCIIRSAIGCYLHGSVLPKNPHLADWLLQKACAMHEKSVTLAPLDDNLEWAAHDDIVGRYV
jgi:CobQ-like glutamine amidotransferase family enzyme